MRFGMIAAAAAALVCAQQAQAATVITQKFSSVFKRYGSTGPIQIGNLNLVNQVITSAVISYGAGQSVTQNVVPQNPTTPVTFFYSGASGFTIQGSALSAPVGVSVAYSGSNQCTYTCSASNDIGGDYIIPQSVLSALAGTGYVQIAPLVTVTTGFSGASFPSERELYAYAGGTITYLIADVAAVPEPATWAMMILGIAMVGGMARRRSAARSTIVA